MLVRPVAKALQVLSRFRLLCELQEVADLGHEHAVHFARAGEEELLARVRMVEARAAKCWCSSDSSVTASSEKNRAVHVEAERNRRATQFVDSVEWLQATG